MYLACGRWWAMIGLFIADYAGCTSGALRLAGSGSSSTQGRLEICYSNRWGTVCDDDWGSNDAKVACRQLGYSTYGMCIHEIRLLQSIPYTSLT